MWAKTVRAATLGFHKVWAYCSMHVMLLLYTALPSCNYQKVMKSFNSFTISHELHPLISEIFESSTV